ncbi:C-C motif chemokine 19, partial [Galemys pyrenaicus]
GPCAQPAFFRFPSPALSGANDAEDCCLSVTQHPIPGHIVRAFRFLLIKDGCRMPAVVFTTVRGRQLCAPLNQPWVTRIIRRLQKNSAKASLTLLSLTSSL